MLGRKPYIQWDATHRDREIVSDILRRMKLESYALRSVSELSGGEAQKVLIARALAQEPRVLALDEPTSNLDPRNQHEVMRLVRSIAREHKISVITVPHDLNLAIRYCDSFMFLKDSKIYAHGGREVMSPEIVEHVYDMHVHIVDCMGIPVFDTVPGRQNARGGRGWNRLKSWDEAAADYQRVFRMGLNDYNRHRWSFFTSNGYATPGRSVLDIGRGVGKYGTYFAELGCGVTLTGHFPRHARARAAEHGGVRHSVAHRRGRFRYAEHGRAVRRR